MEKNWKKYSGISLFILLFCFCFQNTKAQFDTDYFQQETNYNISVSLDDTSNSLEGHIRIEYVNHSPDTLNWLYFHLYPNAYRHQNTVFAKQMLRLGDASFYFSSPEERGYIDSMFFTVNGEAASLHINPDKLPSGKTGIDIAMLELNQPLHPGQKIIIETGFYVQIPEVFSRLGHVGQAYYITQWYPKPAVYDNNGWHPMSYLHMGEYYSEFGDYTVEINVPANYRVAASGKLITETEREWLFNLPDIPADSTHFPSDTARKTIVFKGKNMHDFAWFADKRFNVRHQLWNDSTDVFAFYLPGHEKSWNRVPGDIARTLNFYSSHVGSSPYNSYTAVLGEAGTDGGMEYPGVTLIAMPGGGKELERIVMHEVGHNWFYGSLGFDERRYPWLDEGLNSFYENLYMEKFYPDYKMRLPLIGAIENAYTKDRRHLLPELIYKYTRSLGTDQPANLGSDDYYPENYMSVLYNKTVSAFYYLQAWLGDDEFRDIMHAFYDQWQYKHPGPDDLRQHFEQASGENLSWFFDGLIGSTGDVDYRIKTRTPDSICIENKGKIEAPVFFGTTDSVVRKQGFAGTQTFPNHQHAKCISIDPAFEILEFNRSNDVYCDKLFPRMNPLSLKFFSGIDDFRTNELYYLPVPAFNGLDGFMPGLLLYNNFLPVKQFEYQLMPMFGVKTKHFTGIGNITWRQHLASPTLKTVKLALSGKQFSLDADTRYQKLHAQAGLEFLPENTNINATLDFSFITTSSDNSVPKHYQQLSFDVENHRPVNPYHFSTTIEHGAAYIKWYADMNYRLDYTQHTGLDIRLFGGVLEYYDFENHPNNVNFRLAGTSTHTDYLFRMNALNRSVTANQPEVLSAHQFIPDEGGFAIYTALQSDTWMLSLNLSSETPLPMVNLYGNIATIPTLYESNFFEDTDVLYELGVQINLIDDAVELYIPVLYSEPIKNINGLYSENFWQTIRFRLSLNRLNPFDYRFKTHLLY
ncbi:MAG: M1 family metallopeptidase [Candidatus Delongbacteria bacterium]|nr:M1 family metallopeptidase [Candidatus Delongbacteria bacterium]